MELFATDDLAQTKYLQAENQGFSASVKRLWTRESRFHQTTFLTWLYLVMKGGAYLPLGITPSLRNYSLRTFDHKIQIDYNFNFCHILAMGIPSKHIVINPSILYFGTPVVLISTQNEDGTSNLAPMSSAWWLGKSCMLGLGKKGKTFENLQREKECVLNLPSADSVDAVDRLALTTGSNPIPTYKANMGFQYVPQKFERAQLSALPSDLVKPPRIRECPVQLEARVENIYPLSKADSSLAAIEVSIIRTHVNERILNADKRHHIDPDKWKPLIMNFLEFYGLGEQIHPSRLAEVF